MRVFIISLVAVVSVASGAAAPLTPSALPVSSGSVKHHESSHDKAIQQAAASSAQGSQTYDHGAQASNKFGTKESTGSKENFAFSSSNAHNRGSGGFSHSGGFKNAGHLLTGQGNQFHQMGAGFAPIVAGPVGFGVPAIPSTVFSSEAGQHHQGAVASGQTQGQGQWSYDQGHSSVNSSGNKETFSNKESFGNESSASHATGDAQNSQSQNVQAAHHNKGHQISSAQGGATVVG